MRHEIIMPALGMAQDTGTLLAWHKSEGEAVTQGDILFEVETDKTTMEVESPVSGFLVGVSASDGDEVPVGKVIALISDSAERPEMESDAQDTEATTDANTLPAGEPIIMPVLGMSQDTGVLVGWSKDIGDFVQQDDILFEVETDKSVVEVPAGKSGYLVARLAMAGDDVPTGETIAVISAEKTSQTVDRSYSKAAPTAQPSPQSPVKEAAPVAESKVTARPTAQPRRTPSPGGKILASPKLRRMAHQAGYDLASLAATDHPQPFHASDFEALKQASESADRQGHVSQTGGVLNKLTAQVSGIPFGDFLAWALETSEALGDERVIAAFAGASLADGSVVRIDKRGESKTYSTYQQLSQCIESEGAPDLIVHDLRGTFISAAELPPESVPVISVVGSNDELTLTLACMNSQMAGKDAAVLLDNFAGRLADPVRHLF